ncbi:hypothetical protein PAPHI01_1778 [Pancytospora philotis]|nr:hypothetical protein PAPHI01_1778 [Pancytospora philotis]
MDFSGVTREMVYLCIGDELGLVDQSELRVHYFHGIRYYTVADAKLIRGDSRIHCSCGADYCWHIFKVLMDADKARDAVF